MLPICELQLFVAPADSAFKHTLLHIKLKSPSSTLSISFIGVGEYFLEICLISMLLMAKIRPQKGQMYGTKIRLNNRKTVNNGNPTRRKSLKE